MTFLRPFLALLGLVAFAVAVDAFGVVIGWHRGDGAAVVLLCATIALICRGPS